MPDFIKIAGFVVLSFVLIVSLFGGGKPYLSNNVVAVAVMVLLVTLFSELREFNFWGLRGKKDLRNIKSLKGQPGISGGIPKPTEEKVEKAREEQKEGIGALLNSDSGSFLALAFEIERLLRIAGFVMMGDEAKMPSDPDALTKHLRDLGLLTDSGVEQMRAIRSLRDMFVRGRSDEVDSEMIRAGKDLAMNFYKELSDWLNDPEE